MNGYIKAYFQFMDFCKTFITTNSFATIFFDGTIILFERSLHARRILLIVQALHFSAVAIEMRRSNHKLKLLSLPAVYFTHVLITVYFIVAHVYTYVQ